MPLSAEDPVEPQRRNMTANPYIFSIGSCDTFFEIKLNNKKVKKNPYLDGVWFRFWCSTQPTAETVTD